MQLSLEGLQTFSSSVSQICPQEHCCRLVPYQTRQQMSRNPFLSDEAFVFIVQGWWRDGIFVTRRDSHAGATYWKNKLTAQYA